MRGETARNDRPLPGATLVLLVAVSCLALVVGWGVGADGRPPLLPGPIDGHARLDPELGVPIGLPLRSPATSISPVVDGQVEGVWDQAPLLDVTLHYGLHGDAPAGAMELRSLHDADNVYFLARWPASRSEAAGGEPNVYRNLMTVHWRLIAAGDATSGESLAGEGLACTVGCHTVTADGSGRLVGIRSETIPPGIDEDLPAAGGWSAGDAGWLLEWSRPLVSPNPYDQNLSDPDQTYRFFVKLFLGLDDRPDPVSDVHELRLEP